MDPLCGNFCDWPETSTLYLHECQPTGQTLRGDSFQHCYLFHNEIKVLSLCSKIFHIDYLGFFGVETNICCSSNRCKWLTFLTVLYRSLMHHVKKAYHNTVQSCFRSYTNVSRVYPGGQTDTQIHVYTLPTSHHIYISSS